MSEERRRNQRLNLDVTLELERLDKGGVTTLKYVQVEVDDLSKSGIGFHCARELELESIYNTRLEIWTKEVINTIVRIIRCNKMENGEYRYGGTFIGMTDTDALKIGIYQMLNAPRAED